MNPNRPSSRLLLYAGIPMLTALLLYLIWGGIQTGWKSGEICAGLGLLLAVAALMYLKRMENVSTRSVSQRIRKEYPPELQPQVFAIYEHLKVKELDGLFGKILDDAQGDLNQVQRFASIAESIGWQAYLENKW